MRGLRAYILGYIVRQPFSYVLQYLQWYIKSCVPGHWFYYQNKFTSHSTVGSSHRGPVTRSCYAVSAVSLNNLFIKSQFVSGFLNQLWPSDTTWRLRTLFRHQAITNKSKCNTFLLRKCIRKFQQNVGHFCSNLDILITQAYNSPNKKTRHNKTVCIFDELHCARKNSTDKISFISLTILKQLAEQTRKCKFYTIS